MRNEMRNTMNTKTTITNPVLYILMRTDLESMNSGKSCAQSAHAANQFMLRFERPEDYESAESHRDMYEAWLESGGGFGTTITLDVDAARLGGVYSMAHKAGFPTGITHDPSYPLVDGKVLHLIPLDTCGYVFGDKDALAPLLQQFGLMP